MKKMTKCIISIILALIIMQTAFVNSFALSSSGWLYLSTADVNGFPLQKIEGLPSDFSIYDEGLYNEQHYIYGFDMDLNDSFIAYSDNAVDYSISYLKDLEVLSREDYFEIYFGSSIIINDCFEIVVEIDSLLDSGYYECEYKYLQTYDFKTWVLSEKSVLELPRYARYYGEYHGFYIAANINDCSESNGKVAQKYYISEDGHEWQERHTPYIAKDKISGCSDYDVQGEFNIVVTMNGVLFYYDLQNLGDRISTVTKFGDYIWTTDFENYQTIDLSWLDMCTGKFLGKTGNFDTLRYDSLEFVGFTAFDEVPMFARWQTKGYQNPDTNETYIEPAKLSIYTLDFEKMALEPYFEQEDCQQFSGAMIAKDKCVITTKDSNDECDIYTRSANHFDRQKWSYLDSEDIQFACEIVNYCEENISAYEVNILGLKNSDTLFFTVNFFESVCEIDLSSMGSYFEFEYSISDNIVISTTEEVDGESVKTYYYVDFDKIIKHFHDNHLLECLFGEAQAKKSDLQGGEFAEMTQQCRACGKVTARNTAIDNGWRQTQDWYYYDNGIKVANKWVRYGDKWCYIGFDGNMVTNKWAKDSHGWCYLDKTGYCAKNTWAKDDMENWCYLDANGYRVKNQWRKDSHGWCYLDANGRMATNKWVKDSVSWCYVGADGYCVTNTWKKDSHGWCYLDSNGRMATNKWIKDSVGWCYVGADGYCVTNQWKADSKGWCYLDANGRMMTNSWLQWNGNWYYLDNNGYMVTGTKVINGKTYKFASNGVWIG